MPHVAAMDDYTDKHDKRHRREGTILAGMFIGSVTVTTFLCALVESKPGEVAGALATIIGGGAALTAAWIGAGMIRKQIYAAAKVEDDKRHRSFVSKRAGLAFVTNELSEYLTATSSFLLGHLDARNNELQVPRPPGKQVSELIEFIEVAEPDAADVATKLVLALQIHHARIGDFAGNVRASDRHNIVGYIGDAVLILSLIHRLMDYSRRSHLSATLPTPEQIDTAKANLVRLDERERLENFDAYIGRRAADMVTGDWPIPRPENQREN
jgi:stage V sporulation protein SpoVS